MVSSPSRTRSSPRRPGLAGRTGLPGRPSAAPRKPSPASRGRASAVPPRRTPRFTTRAVVLLSVVLLLLVSYTSALRAWWDQHAEITSLESEQRARIAAIEELEETEGRWNDAAFVEQQARERFGWVMPGEVGYRVIGSDGEPVGGGPRLDDPADGSERAWYDALWGSVEAAGQDPEQGDLDGLDEVLGQR